MRASKVLRANKVLRWKRGAVRRLQRRRLHLFREERRDCTRAVLPAPHGRVARRRRWRRARRARHAPDVHSTVKMKRPPMMSLAARTFFRGCFLLLAVSLACGKHNASRASLVPPCPKVSSDAEQVRACCAFRGSRGAARVCVAESVRGVLLSLWSHSSFVIFLRSGVCALCDQDEDR